MSSNVKNQYSGQHWRYYRYICSLSLCCLLTKYHDNESFLSFLPSEDKNSSSKFSHHTWGLRSPRVRKTMTNKESFIQKIFYEISLEKDPALWQDDLDSREKNAERIQFLSSFEQTRYTSQLDSSKSPSRKNEVLAKALKEKGNKEFSGGDSVAALILYNQALSYSTTEGELATLLGNRSALWADLGQHCLVIRDINQALQWVPL